MKKIKRKLYKVGGKKKYPNGGKVNTLERDPIFVDSKNDPRYKAYSDSLYLHNRYENIVKKHHTPGKMEWEPQTTKIEEHPKAEAYLKRWEKEDLTEQW